MVKIAFVEKEITVVEWLFGKEIPGKEDGKSEARKTTPTSSTYCI